MSRADLPVARPRHRPHYQISQVGHARGRAHDHHEAACFASSAMTSR